MQYNFKKLGVNLEIIDEETCIVHPSKLIQPTSILSSFNDHRIFITLSLITHALDVTIDNETCINKSYPTFLEELERMEVK